MSARSAEKLRAVDEQPFVPVAEVVARRSLTVLRALHAEALRDPASWRRA